MINSFVALDIETTGLNPVKDRIIEIGLAKYIDGVQVDTADYLINPKIQLPELIVNLTGITDEMLEGKPTIDQVIGEVIDFIGEYPMLGHNITFDYSFLKKNASDFGMRMPDKAIDTLLMARRIYASMEHRSLTFLCEKLNIDNGNAHRALDDAISATKLYHRMYEEDSSDFGFEKLITLEYKVKKESPITAAQKRYLSALVDYHNVKLEKAIDDMTKSEASRNIDKILSERGKIQY